MGVKYVKDFEFPSSAGFTGSASDKTTVPVRDYERKRPSLHDQMLKEGKRMGFKQGGYVKMADMDNANIQRKASLAPDQRTKEMGDQPPVRPGFKKGGYADGGRPSIADAAKRRRERLAEIASEGRQAMGAGTTPAPKKPVNRAVGGPVRAKKGGMTKKEDAKQDVKTARKVAEEEVSQHVRAPAPRGHGVKTHNSKPMVGKK